MCLLYSDILWDFHMNMGENLTHTEQDHWRTFIMWQEQKIALCWGTVHTGSERAAFWNVLRSGGWVSHRRITKVWSGNVCVCVCVCVRVCVCVSLIWMLSLETLSPFPQQKDMDMHFQFSQPVMCRGGISFYIGMWSLTLGFVFSKSLIYTVNLFW